MTRCALMFLRRNRNDLRYIMKGADAVGVALGKFCNNFWRAVCAVVKDDNDFIKKRRNGFKRRFRKFRFILEPYNGGKTRLFVRPVKILCCKDRMLYCLNH